MMVDPAHLSYRPIQTRSLRLRTICLSVQATVPNAPPVETCRRKHLISSTRRTTTTVLPLHLLPSIKGSISADPITGCCSHLQWSTVIQDPSPYVELHWTLVPMKIPRAHEPP